MQIKTKWNRDFLNGMLRRETKRIALLYSGGVDSAACALLLKEKGYRVYPLFIAYGQKSEEAEMFAAKSSSQFLGIEPVCVIDMKKISDISLSPLIGVGAQTAVEAWLPARNTFFMTLAGMYAQSIDADSISIGYGLFDNFVFGDNVLVHHQLIEVLLTASLCRPLKVILPIQSMTKAQVMDLVKQKRFLHLTVSCWNASVRDGNIQVCNTCANCLERNSSAGGE